MKILRQCAVFRAKHFPPQGRSLSVRLHGATRRERGREESEEREGLNDFSSKQVLRYHGEVLPDRSPRFHIAGGR